MATAAVPRYLSSDFASASPGMRFSYFLGIWTTRADQEQALREKSNARSREGEQLTQDIQARGLDTVLNDLLARNKLPGLWQKNDRAARTAWSQVLKLNPDDRARMAALAQRQAALADPLQASGRLLRIEASAIAPFATGLGNEHPLENGFAFLDPYGLPYLPASGVKGVLRQAARELAGGEWGDSCGWDQEQRYVIHVGKQRIPLSMLDLLFGKESQDRDTDHVRGALTFWDVYPQIKGDALQVEVMTPHQTHYYQNGQDPHESGSPNPINFLTVPPGSGFVFHVQCNLPFLAATAEDLAKDQRWQALLRAAFTHAFDWLGFGAKTAVGYGAMQRDEAAEAAAKNARAEREQASRQAEESTRLAREREAALAALSPIERSIQEFLDQRPDKNQTGISAVLGAVKQGRWPGDEKTAVARWLQQEMQISKGQWKETSQAKKPEKDKEFQNTLLVKQWLAGK